VEQCVFNQIQFTPSHLIASLKITLLNLVEQCVFNKIRFIQTHPIALLKTTELNLVEQCVFNQTQFIQIHIIAFLKTIQHNRVEHCIYNKYQFIPIHLIVYSQTMVRKITEDQYLLNMVQFTQTPQIAFFYPIQPIKVEQYLPSFNLHIQVHHTVFLKTI
jgi:hypothetical protein